MLFNIILLLYFVTTNSYGANILAGINNFDRMTKVFQWKQIGYSIDNVKYTQDAQRQIKPDSIYFFDEDLEDSELFFKQYNNIPIGLAVYKDRVFVTVPRRRYGIPSTLNYVYLNATQGSSPLLMPYPDSSARGWFVSMYRPRVDACNRLWVVDTGLLEVPNAFVQQKPPEIVVYDLKTDREILRHRLGDDVLDGGTTSGLTSITVDVSPASCDDAHAYITDLAANGLVVFSLRLARSWRVTHHTFRHDVGAMNFTVGGYTINWRDGLFSVALGETDASGRRKVYYHPYISTQEYSISNEVLKNRNGDFDRNFKLEGVRGAYSQSGSHDYHAATHTLLFANVARDAILCWDTRTKLTSKTAVVVASDQELRYISDLKVVGDEVWVLSNRITDFIYSRLDTNQYNFFVHRVKVRDLIAGTACDGRS